MKNDECRAQADAAWSNNDCIAGRVMLDADRHQPWGVSAGERCIKVSPAAFGGALIIAVAAVSDRCKRPL